MLNQTLPATYHILIIIGPMSFHIEIIINVMIQKYELIPNLDWPLATQLATISFGVLVLDPYD